MAARADKRQAILDASLQTFARDGYTRASIDTIAKEAGVSTRTIYNHFPDKATLFAQVIQDSAERVAEVHVGLIETYLRKVTDLEDDLTDFALALARQGVTAHATHFALVRQINADAEHLPEAAVRGWLDAGPLKVRRVLADRLAALPGLALPDPVRAARNLVALTSPDVFQDPAEPDEAQVRAGVRVFLHGYAAG